MVKFKNDRKAMLSIHRLLYKMLRRIYKLSKKDTSSTPIKQQYSRYARGTKIMNKDLTTYENTDYTIAQLKVIYEHCRMNEIITRYKHFECIRLGDHKSWYHHNQYRDFCLAELNAAEDLHYFWKDKYFTCRYMVEQGSQYNYIYLKRIHNSK